MFSTPSSIYKAATIYHPSSTWWQEAGGRVKWAKMRPGICLWCNTFFSFLFFEVASWYAAPPPSPLEGSSCKWGAYVFKKGYSIHGKEGDLKAPILSKPILVSDTCPDWFGYHLKYVLLSASVLEGGWEASAPPNILPKPTIRRHQWCHHHSGEFPIFFAFTALCKENPCLAPVSPVTFTM